MALVKIGKAAEMLGVEVQTLRAWEASGELIPDRRSKGGVRYYDVGKILGLGNEDMPTIGYARVSSHDQKPDDREDHQEFEESDASVISN